VLRTDLDLREPRECGLLALLMPGGQLGTLAGDRPREDLLPNVGLADAPIALVTGRDHAATGSDSQYPGIASTIAKAALLLGTPPGHFSR
jgi:hypothetical protein